MPRQISRLDGHRGACLQQDVPWRGWLRGDVLRPRLRHVPGQPHHQVRVQVPLVLRRAVPGLPAAGGRAHLQGPDVTGTLRSSSPALVPDSDSRPGWSVPISLYKTTLSNSLLSRDQRRSVSDPVSGSGRLPLGRPLPSTLLTGIMRLEFDLADRVPVV
ncbi:unnamed protein product [Tetraodon nigroviridis]|uniref:(spotted green pufferfish) hypothetical protein n=1 Tax=Tetraodon nigroviridis TaxID=99883 RepID=Q4RS79_TETNG|nr:unnamed protein product [Tetraodon nigroviridis]